MPANVHPEFVFAEKEYSEATTIQEKIKSLERMISFAPSHKGGEKLRAQLRTRYKNLQETLKKSKKSGRSVQQGIKKADMQVILVGPPNSGKSTLFKELTNQETLVTPYPHSTTENMLGTINFEDVKIQLIDTPSFPNTDKGLLHTTDTILVVVEKIGAIRESMEEIGKTKALTIIVITKTDLWNLEEKRRLEATLKSKFKNYNYILFNRYLIPEEIEQIKRKIFHTFPIIRVYTKEPKKEHSKEPMILKKGAKVKDAAERISKNLKKQTKSAKIWGPSSKFPGQSVGPNHTLKDKDIVEIKLN